MKKLRNIHPGEILSKEFLLSWNISLYRLSKDAGIRFTTLSAIVKRRRRISTDTASKLAVYFGNSSKFWLELQNDFDLNRRMRW